MENELKIERLEKSINLNQKKIYTSKVSLTIAEIQNNYYNWSLIIDPVFQRLFRRTKVQKSKFIESIFLWMPIPSIFVAENENWQWELIDWLQRISTILEFTWMLKEKNKSLLKNRSIEDWLIKTPYLGKEIEWIKWNDLSEKLKNKFNFSRIDVNILLEGSNTDIKFDLFDRLNSLWSIASPQEKRRSIIIMKDKKYYRFMQDLLSNQDYKSMVTNNLPDNDAEQLLDEELILRFFSILIYKKWDPIYSISDYIDSKIDILIKTNKENSEKQKILFIKTMKIIKDKLWIDAFKRLDKKTKLHNWRFIIPVFDIFAWWIWYNIQRETLVDEKEIESIVKWFWEKWRDDKKNNINVVWSKFWTGVEGKFRKAAEIGRNLFCKNNNDS